MLRNKIALAAATAVVAIAGIGTSNEAAAVPAFARQTGMACYSCHFQSFPTLNSFGRSFKAGGYTMRGAQGLIEDDHLSLPSNLNMAFVSKFRYTTDKDTVDGRGGLDVPDEAAMFAGGRVSEHQGFIAEVAVIPGSAGIAGYKTQFNVADSFAIGWYATDGQGPAYGFELMNTGLQSAQRPIENAAAFSAWNLTGISKLAAEGLAFTYHTNDFYVNYSHWANNFGSANVNPLGGLGSYIRAAYMPTVGDWDLGIGVASMSGTTKAGATNPATELTVEAMGFDVQAQGELAGMPAGFWFSYASVPNKNGSNFNAATADVTAMGLLGKVAVVHGINAFVGYSSKDAGAATGTETRTTVGFQFEPSQNVEIELYNTSASNAANDQSKTQLVMFSGF